MKDRTFFLIWAFCIGFGVCGLLTCLPGCEEQQIEDIDRFVKDANEVVSGVGAVLESPAGALLPPNLQLYGAIAVAIASVGVNTWQKIKGNLMKKTTKAIVKGIELADKPKTNPMSTVKKTIKAEMELAGILDKGNQLVDQLKVAR
jgi:hypothetical protein